MPNLSGISESGKFLEMTREQFKQWMSEMEYTRAAAAEALGYSIRQIDNFTSNPNSIPKHVNLACAALYRGLQPYSEGAQFQE